VPPALEGGRGGEPDPPRARPRAGRASALRAVQPAQRWGSGPPLVVVSVEPRPPGGKGPEVPGPPPGGPSAEPSSQRSGGGRGPSGTNAGYGGRPVSWLAQRAPAERRWGLGGLQAPAQPGLCPGGRPSGRPASAAVGVGVPSSIPRTFAAVSASGRKSRPRRLGRRAAVSQRSGGGRGPLR